MTETSSELYRGIQSVFVREIPELPNLAPYKHKMIEEIVLDIEVKQIKSQNTDSASRPDGVNSKF